MEDLEDNPNVRVAQETARNLSERASSLTQELERLQFEQQKFKYTMAGKDIKQLDSNICEPVLDNTYHYRLGVLPSGFVVKQSEAYKQQQLKQNYKKYMRDPYDLQSMLE